MAVVNFYNNIKFKKHKNMSSSILNTNGKSQYFQKHVFAINRSFRYLRKFEFY